MSRSLQDSVVVITGASSGIGRATARAFARHGSALLLAARRPLRLSAVAVECHELGAKALAVPADVTDEHGLTALAHKAVETFGRIDVWFSNAGVAIAGDLESIPAEVLHKAMETNLMSFIYAARACLPHFRKQGHGVLINNACLLDGDVPERMALYVAAKWAVRGLGLALRRDLAGTGIHVCSLLCEPAETSFVEHGANFSGWQLEAPRRRLSPETVADAVVRCVDHPRAEVIVRGSGGTFGLNRHQVEHHHGALLEPAPDLHVQPVR